MTVFTGGGVEPESHYPQWKRVHQNIERYQALNDSIAKLAEGNFIDNWHVKLHRISPDT